MAIARVNRYARISFAVAAIAAILFWISSYVMYTRIALDLPYVSHQIQLGSGCGVLGVLYLTEGRMYLWLPAMKFHAASEEAEYLFFESGLSGRYGASSFRDGRRGDGSGWNYELFTMTHTYPTKTVQAHYYLLWVPWWFLVLLFSIWPGCFAVRRYLRSRRAQDGMCSQCGYDLRGNPSATHCPECGERIASCSIT